MQRKSVAAAVFVALAFACTAMSCQRVQQANPLAVAVTAEQKSYALYGTFVIFEEQAAKLAAEPATPAAARDALIAADALAKPVADSMMDAVLQLDAVKAELATAPDHDAKLLLAAQRLSTWVAQAEPKITALVNAVRGVHQ